jgi:hypothetical protein
MIEDRAISLKQIKAIFNSGKHHLLEMRIRTEYQWTEWKPIDLEGLEPSLALGAFCHLIKSGEMQMRSAS